MFGRFSETRSVLTRSPARWPAETSRTPAGTFHHDVGRIFALLLIGVILIVGALTFFPAFSLGPIVEHLQVYRREDILT